MDLSIAGHLSPQWLSTASSGLNSITDGIRSATDASGQAAITDGLEAFSYESDFLSAVALPPPEDPFNPLLFLDTWNRDVTATSDTDLVQKALQDPELDIQQGLNLFVADVFGDEGIAPRLLGSTGFLTEMFPDLFAPMPLPDFQPGADVMINPQPLPPGGLEFQPGSDVMINPQPLPPGGLEFQPGSDVMINPQPLPPGSDVMINPQPLPPGAVSDNRLMLSQPQALLVQNDFSTIDDSIYKLQSALSSEDKQLSLSSLLMNVFKLQDMESILKQQLDLYSSIPQRFGF